MGSIVYTSKIVNLCKDASVPLTELLPVLDVTSCCSPLTRETIAPRDAEDLARSLRALADPARLRIISIVAASEQQEVCVCEFPGPLELSQPTVSHHLKILVDAGYLQREKRGTWAYYRLVPGALDSVSNLLVSASPATH